jgi:hypothetical protein
MLASGAIVRRLLASCFLLRKPLRQEHRLNERGLTAERRDEGDGKGTDAIIRRIQGCLFLARRKQDAIFLPVQEPQIVGGHFRALIGLKHRGHQGALLFDTRPILVRIVKISARIEGYEDFISVG